MKQPDGFDGREGGAPYWILPSGQKTYDYEEWRKADNKSMNEMIKDRPITPEEVRARRIDFIPSIIFETINTMICEKFDGKSATLRQNDILNEVCNECSGLTRQEIFKKHYLDIEPFYREQGWKVEYDKPGYNESYPATFTFKIP